MQHLNDYPNYFLAPSKINGAIASFGHSHVVQLAGINCCWELFVTVSKAGNHYNKSESSGEKCFTAGGAVAKK